MTAMRILNGLERSSATGAEADAVARMGFLKWAFELDGDATPGAARDALSSVAAQDIGSDAARAFVGFLQAAACPVMRSSGRRRGRRVLH